MKYCLSSNQTKEYLDKADEIMVKYKDREIIFDLIEKYPSKCIIIDCYEVDDIDWKEMTRYNILAKNNFVLKVSEIDYIREASACNIKSYYGYPVETYWELEALQMLGVEYVTPGVGLFFNMDDFKRACKNTKVRIVPNVAYDDPLPHANGVHGTWIRPEDLEEIYGEYIDVVEFEDCDREKEQALYRIYAEQHEWRQELQMLITNLDYPGVNRMLLSQVSESRLNCGQRCHYSNCHICERSLDLANPSKMKEYIEEVQLPIGASHTDN